MKWPSDKSVSLSTQELWVQALLRSQQCSLIKYTGLALTEDFQPNLFVFLFYTKCYQNSLT